MRPAQGTLQEVKLEVKDFAAEYSSSWALLREKVDSFGRTEEKASVATARVHLTVLDLTVKELKNHAFSACSNLVSLHLPNIEVIGGFAAADSHSLNEVKLRPDVKIASNSFAYCLTLEVLANSCGFKTEGKKTSSGRNNATAGITRYLHWRAKMDANKELFLTTTSLLKLCNTVNKASVLGWFGFDLPMRASTAVRVMNFLISAGDDITRHILSFSFGVKVGKGDLRELSKEKLLEVGLETKVLRMENNGWGNKQFWGVAVDGEGKVVRLEKAIGGGLITRANSNWVWGLTTKMNGDVVDRVGHYGEKGTIIGRIHRNMVVPF